jgi:DNA-binding transcriptional MerR regulator
VLRDLVDGADADEPVDGSAERVGLSELEADERGYEVELRDRDEPPVQTADDYECCGGDVELLHCSLLGCIGTVQGLYSDGHACQMCVQCLYNSAMALAPQLRIGELSRRIGVSPELLRAWERRYGLLRPERSGGGFRLYGPADEQRIRLMQEHLERGLSAAEAARLSLAGERPALVEAEPDSVRSPTRARARLTAALDDFDELEAQAVLDDLLASFTLDTVLGEVVLPYLHELGDRWAVGEITVAQEHYASSLLRGRLLGLARGWGNGLGPRVVLAGAPGEQHDLGLIAFGLALRGRGWRVTFLGQDTPLQEVAGVARALDPALVVVTATVPSRLAAVADDLRAVAEVAPLAIAGAGADAVIAGHVGGRLLEGDPVSAAEALGADMAR